MSCPSEQRWVPWRAAKPTSIHLALLHFTRPLPLSHFHSLNNLHFTASTSQVLRKQEFWLIGNTHGGCLAILLLGLCRPVPKNVPRSLLAYSGTGHLGRLLGPQPEAALGRMGQRQSCKLRSCLCGREERVKRDCCHSIRARSPPIPRTLSRAIHKPKERESPSRGTFATTARGVGWGGGSFLRGQVRIQKPG
jgi:hypothetical protein